jgi:hypothetical protein
MDGYPPAKVLKCPAYFQGPDDRRNISSRCKVGLHDQGLEKILSRSNTPPSPKLRVEPLEQSGTVSRLPHPGLCQNDSKKKQHSL